LETLAYMIKQRLPGMFRVIAVLAQWVVGMRFGRRLRRVQAQATIEGYVCGQTAVMRPLTVDDLGTLHDFLETQPEDHLRYFRPHGFDRVALRRVLASQAFLNYGLFVGDRLAAYALLKVAPTGSAFRGRLVGNGWTGLGLGRFISEYIYWQASEAGLRARATISRNNIASLKSLDGPEGWKVIANLPNNYLLIEFPLGSPEPPVLAANQG